MNDVDSEQFTMNLKNGLMTEDDLDGDTASRTGYHQWPWPI